MEQLEGKKKETVIITSHTRKKQEIPENWILELTDISVQVLPDGSIKKTNKTVIVDENGQGYVYHSVHHVIHSDDTDQETDAHDDSAGEVVDETPEEPPIDVTDEDAENKDHDDGEEDELTGEVVDETAEEPSIDLKDVKSPGEDDDPKGEGDGETADELSIDVTDQGEVDHEESTGDDIEPNHTKFYVRESENMICFPLNLFILTELSDQTWSLLLNNV